MPLRTAIRELVAACPYREVASGSIPLFLIASEARAEARNSISRLEPSGLRAGHDAG